MNHGLGLWMNGEHVGVWQPGAPHRLEYARSWLDSPRARPLSLSLPLTADRTHRGRAVENYFDNLLPDNDAIRRRIRARFATRSTQAFDLLAAVGRDCVGAVQLLPLDETPSDLRRIECEPLSEAQIAAVLRSLRSTSAFGSAHDTADFRISIAGVQEKTALVRHDGRWCRPLGSTPTTHILKLPLGRVGRDSVDFTASVENEWLCAELFRAFGLDAAQSSMAWFEDQRALVVERFDRAWQDGAHGAFLLRIPQEDLCQATGTAWSQKYERDGGPGMAQCLRIMSTSADPQDATLTFIVTQLLFWLLAATDGHAKNFSVFLERGGAYSPTPVYDVLSAWPAMGKRAHTLQYPNAGLAMAIRSRNAHYKLEEIQARHWHHLAKKHGGPGLWDAVLGVVASVDAVLGTVEARLPGDFPEPVWDAVSKGIRRHAKRFSSGLSHLEAVER